MSQKLLLLLPLLIYTSLYAFEDNDIDGVEDSVDLCPNTPFDVLVNETGCPKKGEKSQKNNYYGRLTLKAGADISRDKSYEDSDTLNLYANYLYHKWDISISNALSTTKNIYSESSNDQDSNIYLSTGYQFSLSKSTIKISLGTKIVNTQETSSEQNGHRKYENREGKNLNKKEKNSYFASFDLDYFLNEKQDIFAYYSYSDEKENYSSFSIGTGYNITNNWYSGLSYNYTQSPYKDSDAQQSLYWLNSYSFHNNIFATLSYQYALDDLSYDQTLSLGVGVYFE